jgi:hypothetical protein
MDKKKPFVFPYIINDELQLSRLILGISRDTAKRTAHEILIANGLIKTMMTKGECEKVASRRKMEDAMLHGELKYVVKGKKTWFVCTDFYDWLETDSWIHPPKPATSKA